MELCFYCGFHGLVLLFVAGFVYLEERVIEKEGGSIDKAINLCSLVILIFGCESADDEAILKKIHAFWECALMISNIDYHRPIP